MSLCLVTTKNFIAEFITIARGTDNSFQWKCEEILRLLIQAASSVHTGGCGSDQEKMQYGKERHRKFNCGLPGKPVERNSGTETVAASRGGKP